MRKRNLRWGTVLFVAAILPIVFPAGAVRRVGRERTLQELTQQSDSVIIGHCRSKNVRFSGKLIETEYEVEVTDQLKGGKPTAARVITLTLPGGEMTTPPLTQYVPLQAHMYAGEDVALFLKEYTAEPPASVAKRVDRSSRLFTSPQIVGWYEGKFTVFTGTDGKRKIARVNLESHRTQHTDAALQRVIKAISTGAVQTINGPAIPLGDGLYTNTAGKQIIDRVQEGLDEQKTGTAVAASPGRSTKALSVQDLEEFKDQVRKFSK